MSLRVFLGISFVLMVILPTATSAAEPKSNQSNQSSVASDRHAAPSRSARKEAADDDDDKKPARKTRAQKDDDDKKPAGKARAQKDDDYDKRSAGKARARKDDDDEKPAGKARARKDDDDDKKSPGKARAQKDDDDDKKSPGKARARKDDDDDKKASGKARAQKDDDDDKKAAGKARARRDDDDDKKSPGKARAQKDDDDTDKKSAGKGRTQKEATRDGQPEARRAASELSSDNETLAALKQQLRDLRKQVSDRERLRAELSAVKAQLQGSVRAAAEPSSDNETLPALKQQLRDLRKQLGDMERLRVELAAIKAQLRDSAPKPVIWGGVPLTLPRSLSEPPRGSPVIAALALPIPDVRDLVDRTPLKPPVNPATDSSPAVIREQPQGAPPPKSAVEEAKAYLVKTATPGYTMTRQGVSVAIDRLHPGFAVKLAQAVKRARDEGLTEAGIFSAYRPPAFGIGAFSDKFDSLHSYGLATDITGIGGPGSASAHRWHQIVLDVGLYLPYGSDHRSEFNHTQFIPEKVAPRALRETITADAPIDLRRMWLASGVDAYITEPQAVAVAGGPGNSASADAGSDEPNPAAPKPAAPTRSE